MSEHPSFSYNLWYQEGVRFEEVANNTREDGAQFLQRRRVFPDARTMQVVILQKPISAERIKDMMRFAERGLRVQFLISHWR